MTAKGRIRYSEGQWFAVPLIDGGYALGIIVRGSYETKGGLGFFFAPRYANIPDATETHHRSSTEAILTAWFGDLGIIEGRWPLVGSTDEFNRDKWPVPKFKRIDPIKRSVGWLVEYSNDAAGLTEPPVRETVHTAAELTSFPKDGVYGARALEIRLTKLLTSED
jgi:hypothetical protein